MTPTPALARELSEAIAGLEIRDAIPLLAKRFHGAITFATSLGAEDQVLTHIVSTLSQPIEIFTLDTGRLHPETYTLLDRTVQKYGVPITVYFPDYRELETWITTHGINGFYDSIENRKACCRLRKLEPLNRALAGKSLWITGLRAAQSVTRQSMELIEWDEAHQILKYNPLLHWSEEEIWHYAKQHNVPVNPLHTQGFASIGCAPCTRAVKNGENIRAGRWWWESPEHKECGLHK